VKRILLISVAAATALTVVAVSFGATSLKLSTVPPAQLKFNKKALVAKAGKVTIAMANPSILSHNIALRKGTKATSKLLVKGKIVGKGGVSRITIKLRRGKYRFLGTVPGHEAAGMWGILTVK
jgi:uncharacterized cupredoxin-like copper-binding protein